MPFVGHFRNDIASYISTDMKCVGKYTILIVSSVWPLKMNSCLPEEKKYSNILDLNCIKDSKYDIEVSSSKKIISVRCCYWWFFWYC